MAKFKKNYAKKSKSMKKYSLSDRYNYYDKIIDEGYNKAQKKDGSFDSSIMKKSKYEKASGYCQTIERGRPLDFDKRSKAYQNGCVLAEKAKKKANSIKF